MLELINRDRLAHGLQPLQADMHLTRLARLKSQDIVDNNYFDHRSPTYGTAFDMFRANGIIFIRGGENLSKAGSVQVSHLRLMNSPNHRANLLNPTLPTSASASSISILRASWSRRCLSRRPDSKDRCNAVFFICIG